MTDDHTEHDELRRRLAEEGNASAPPDLAGEVMRRVRAEPRRGERPAWLRPTLALVAASVLVVAALAGISRVGGTSSSGSGSVGALGPEAGSAGGGTSAPWYSIAGNAAIRDVPAARLHDLLGAKRYPQTLAQADALACQPVRVDLRVPSAVYDTVQSRLQAAAELDSAARRVTVVLHRGGTALRTIRVTCP